MAYDLKEMLGGILNNLNVQTFGLPKEDEVLLTSLLKKIRNKQSLTADEKTKAMNLLAKFSGKVSPAHKKLVLDLLDKAGAGEKNQDLVKQIKKTL